MYSLKTLNFENISTVRSLNYMRQEHHLMLALLNCLCSSEYSQKYSELNSYVNTLIHVIMQFVILIYCFNLSFHVNV